jgi:(p)ppGpp synthase/HD superfamily hydrolase
VATIVEECGSSPEMIAAAWLHDTVEDTGVTIYTIRELFGQKVADLVSDLTDVSVPEDGNRAVRKELDRHHTAAAHPDSKTVKLADLIDNTASIMEHDLNFARIYVKEKEALLKVLTEGDIELYKRATEVLVAAKEKL